MILTIVSRLLIVNFLAKSNRKITRMRVIRKNLRKIFNVLLIHLGIVEERKKASNQPKRTEILDTVPLVSIFFIFYFFESPFDYICIASLSAYEVFPCLYFDHCKFNRKASICSALRLKPLLMGVNWPCLLVDFSAILLSFLLCTSLSCFGL